MPTYLLSWNASRGELDWAKEQESIYERAGVVCFVWACGNTKRIRPGDRAVFLRQRLEPRGVLAVGLVEDGPFETKHWDPTRARQGATALTIRVVWDYFSAEPVIPRERLDHAPYDGVFWNTQKSGISIADDVADVLIDEFWNAAATRPSYLPEELSGATHLIPEGARRKILIDSYERSARARDLCISHHGVRCSACGANLQAIYGEAAAGLIHVHHLIPVADVGRDYEIDPIEDLRPVCPNCHSVIHRRVPPYHIAEIREMLNCREGEAGSRVAEAASESSGR